MDSMLDPCDYSTETLLRRVAAQNAELRELLKLLAQEPERLACEHPELVSRLPPRARRTRRRRWEAGS